MNLKDWNLMILKYSQSKRIQMLRAQDGIRKKHWALFFFCFTSQGRYGRGLGYFVEQGQAGYILIWIKTNALDTKITSAAVHKKELWKTQCEWNKVIS